MWVAQAFFVRRFFPFVMFAKCGTDSSPRQCLRARLISLFLYETEMHITFKPPMKIRIRLVKRAWSNARKIRQEITIYRLAHSSATKKRQEKKTMFVVALKVYTLSLHPFTRSLRGPEWCSLHECRVYIKTYCGVSFLLSFLRGALKHYRSSFSFFVAEVFCLPLPE